MKFKQTALGSGLVAETLLVAVLLHALLALVLVDFCFTAFLDGAHGVCCRCYVTVRKSGDDFIEWIFDNALRAQALELRDNVSNDDFVNHSLNCHPIRPGTTQGPASWKRVIHMHRSNIE